ncbi:MULTISPECIES: beta-ketoacyl-[acyl-carrier-protein] synthase family protein [Maribacter]|uniref:Beta-ketoacyl-[acyl-carrier-protein] synthase family protein n=1 Tax=Maribacter flavus TaxID=1658664 RepID=A0ABU7IDU5_9FLAO|nr:MULTISPECIES: beta-ketoacyl-[acyl-carrier-protein] synthase family protein [Maribacter]MDC6403882.1 beta-ketoacyl-[acyl-carrier-protein] synthase family protein [Maribacter sp. PR66]MEE1971023.1 beta-ketoacyl-[acyl-carrier-protein] synthase family protein [Maribacter flavus]
MNQGVAITGMGLISAIGNNVADNFASLISGTTGISKISRIKTVHEHEIMVGEVPLTNGELEKLLGLPADSHSRTPLLGIMAAKEALAQAEIQDISEYRTGLISGTTVGGMDKSEQYFYDFYERDLHWNHINSLHAGDSTQKIADAIGLTKSFVTTISTACSSAANAIMLGARMIKSGELDRVIVGGSDSLSKFTINGFKTLMILSDTYNTPFDEHRKGLNLGEAAAFLILESDAIVSKENKKVLAYVKGYGNANDAYHQTASSENGDGAVMAMEKALKVAGITPSKVDYINAHGTATPNNDLSEGRALLRVFNENVPEFSSTKPFTGHTLAVAAGVEAVYSVLSIQNNVIYPNLNFKTPMTEFNLVPETQLKNKEIKTVLSNSFGFGGNCSTLIFTKEA